MHQKHKKLKDSVVLSEASRAVLVKEGSACKTGSIRLQQHSIDLCLWGLDPSFAQTRREPSVEAYAHGM